MELTIKSNFPVLLRDVVNSHGWVKLAPWGWDSQSGELSRTHRFSTGVVATLTVSQIDVKTFLVTAKGGDLGSDSHQEAERIVTRWLSLDWDPEPAIMTANTINPSIAVLLLEGYGRFLRSTTPYEDFIKTICTININWPSTIRMISSLVEQLGFGLFPNPPLIRKQGEQSLRRDLRLGFRSRTIVEMTKSFLDQGIIDDSGDLKQCITYEKLTAVPGIGPYSASHALMLEHDFSRIPVDSEVAAYCKDRYGSESEGINHFFDRWGEFRFLGYKLSRFSDDMKSRNGTSFKDHSNPTERDGGG